MPVELWFPVPFLIHDVEPELVGAVDMAPARLSIFPSEYFHAAYHPQNSFQDFPRLTLAFWMVC